MTLPVGVSVPVTEDVGVLEGDMVTVLVTVTVALVVAVREIDCVTDPVAVTVRV